MNFSVIFYLSVQLTVQNNCGPLTNIYLMTSCVEYRKIPLVVFNISGSFKLQVLTVTTGFMFDRTSFLHTYTSSNSSSAAPRVENAYSRLIVKIL